MAVCPIRCGLCEAGLHSRCAGVYDGGREAIFAVCRCERCYLGLEGPEWDEDEGDGDGVPFSSETQLSQPMPSPSPSKPWGSSPTTSKSVKSISGQLRSGGGGGMHTSG